MVDITEALLIDAMGKARPVVAGIVQNWHDTEDCLQDACVSALQHAADFRGDCKFSTWFMWVAKNHALMRLRKGRNAVGRAMCHVENLDSIPRRSLNPEQIAIAKNQNGELTAALMGLYPTMRAELLRWAAGEHENTSDNRVRRCRAKAALREALR